ncbi:hypothetical protein HKX48_000865 [Thoreauomyces humboldtii]|nr:hypothetical protein HKX48_000865 [Thoreauomyces humboldtii]
MSDFDFATYTSLHTLPDFPDKEIGSAWDTSASLPVSPMSFPASPASICSLEGSALSMPFDVESPLPTGIYLDATYPVGAAGKLDAWSAQDDGYYSGQQYGLLSPVDELAVPFSFEPMPYGLYDAPYAFPAFEDQQRYPASPSPEQFYVLENAFAPASHVQPAPLPSPYYLDEPQYQRHASFSYFPSGAGVVSPPQSPAPLTIAPSAAFAAPSIESHSPSQEPSSPSCFGSPASSASELPEPEVKEDVVVVAESVRVDSQEMESPMESPVSQPEELESPAAPSAVVAEAAPSKKQRKSSDVAPVRASSHRGNASGNPPHPKPFHCELCTASFSRKHDLKRHTRIHLGIRPFVCSNAKCAKVFSRHDALARHLIKWGCDRKAADGDDYQETRESSVDQHPQSPYPYDSSF